VTLTTESRNPHSSRIDEVSTSEMVRIMSSEDERAVRAVNREGEASAAAIDAIADKMQSGGRLIYVGAGTSGRLGVLDAAECPPTFGTPPGMVVALIAGGDDAVIHSVEGAEDDTVAGIRDVAALNVKTNDAVVGISASGGTPYVLGAMQEARRRHALVVSVACNRPTPMAVAADISIAPVVGPEILTGSTRLKAGTAQKLVLNAISTGTMIRLGKTYGNLMVDVQQTNAKLRQRARQIVAAACDVNESEAAALLVGAEGSVKVAIVGSLAGISPDEARERLAAHGGVVKRAVAG
jgi:N-acetylmuramic acid 6-phosphate etherase